MISILCLKWGDKYGPEYVNRLYNQCKEFINLNFKFYCATDNSKKINPEIKILDYNDYAIPVGRYGGSNQGKVFTAEKIKLICDERFYDTRVLLLDLDILILKDLTNYLNNYHPNKLALYKSWWYDDKLFKRFYGKVTCRLNSSFMYTYPKNVKIISQKLFNKNYDYYAFKFYSLDRTIQYNFLEHIEFHKDKRLLYSYSNSKSKRKLNYKVCIFNNSHGKGEDLHDLKNWAYDYWKSYD